MQKKSETTYTLRVRTGLQAGIATIYGTDWCAYTTRQKQAFDEAHVPYRYVNCDTMKDQCSGITSLPTVVGYPTADKKWVGFKPV